MEKTLEDIKEAFLAKAAADGVGVVYAGTWGAMPADTMAAFMKALRKRAGNEQDKPLPGEIVYGESTRRL